MTVKERLWGLVSGGRHKSPAPARESGTDDILRQARLPPAELLTELQTRQSGLTEREAAERLARVGANTIAREQQQGPVRELIERARNPLNALLLTLAVISWMTGDLRAAIVIIVMIVLSITLAFVQEHRSNRAAASLRALVHNTASVSRTPVQGGAQGTFAPGTTAPGNTQGTTRVDVAVNTLVPGDIVNLAAGDLIPADLRVLSGKDLHVNQSSLTGEAMAVEKHPVAPDATIDNPFDLPNVCFMGSNVVSGSAICVVLRTGAATVFGHLADTVLGARPPTDFDKGIGRFTWLMIRFIGVMVPTVFLINGLTKGDWLEALLFAMAVAVGMTPEMLPMIVTMNLAKGALAMAAKRVIVERLSAIQNLGAMDVLCTDKTGTLTQDRIILQYHLDFEGEESARVLEYAFLNSRHQSGLRNLLDEAILSHATRPEHALDHAEIAARYTKIDEMPFDFQRRRMSVVLDRGDGTHILIAKGAVEEIFAVCTNYVLGEAGGPLDPTHFDDAKREMEKLNREGFRVVAVAFKEIAAPRTDYSIADESDLTLLGYVAFLDPPKESAAQAIVSLHKAGVAVKILTGDNEVITRTVCTQVGLPPGKILLGSEVEAMSDIALGEAAEATTVFAKLAPGHKARVIAALRQRGHVVGFMGDGINDGPALKAADVGISVDTAVDIAKESADIILLEKSLLVLDDGVMEGRRIFGNITKYIRMGASSNFGNMFSVIGASIFLPFLPMAPLQVLTNNLLYDFSQTTIPTDQVDPEYLAVPRRWDIGHLTRFVLCVGPVSSLFDFLTFMMMIYVFDGWNNVALFQTGWFVESLMTQTLIIHIIRTARVPFLQSRASLPLILTTIVIVAVGGVLPYTPVGSALGFVPLPPLYWACVSAMMVAYAVLTHVVKMLFIRRWGL